MGLAMRKGAGNCAGVIFGIVHKLVWYISQCGPKISHPARILEVSTGSIKEIYVSHLFPSLIASVIEPSRAFCCLTKALVVPNWDV